jgi:two-component system response regulator AtoC
MPRILVVDDNHSIRQSARMILAASASVRTAALSDDVLALMAGEPADILILGLSTPLERPLHMLREVLIADPHVRVLLLADRTLLAAAQRIFNHRIEAILPKPFDVHILRSQIREILSGHDRLPTLLEEIERAETEAQAPKPELALLLPRALHPFFSRLGNITAHTVIEGERGTGKSRLAGRIQMESPGRAAPYLRLDARSLTEARLAAAIRELAGEDPFPEPRATLCIEEVGALTADLQTTLRDLAEGAFPPGTPPRARRMGLRLITTTSVPLSDLVAQGCFQEELREALSVLLLRLPPLRERGSELEELFREVADDWARRYARERVRFSQAALDLLSAYLWPGNLRELSSVIGRALALTDGDEVPAEAVIFGDPPALSPEGQVELPPADEGVAAATGAEAAGRRAPAEPAAQQPSTPWTALEMVAHLLSHEVKNPLVAIKTFTQLLKDKFDDHEFRHRFYEIVSADVERIDSLVEAASAFSRLGPPSPTAVDLNAMIDHILKDFELTLLRKRVVVLRESGPALPFARADREQLVYALRCLIAKAVDLMPEGSDLRFSCGFAPARPGADQRIQATVRFANPEGIVLDLPTLAGEPGEEGGPPGSLEIGLAKEIVERQGGSLQIDLPGERDTVLTIELPTI